MEPKEDFKSVEEMTLTPVTDIEIRELAEIYDEKDDYLSVYLPTASREDESANRAFIDARRRAIEVALPQDLKDLFRETMAMVGDLLFWKPIPGERSSPLHPPPSFTSTGSVSSPFGRWSWTPRPSSCPWRR
jgi:peptide chain release factor subunit 1